MSPEEFVTKVKDAMVLPKGYVRPMYMGSREVAQVQRVQEVIRQYDEEQEKASEQTPS